MRLYKYTYVYHRTCIVPVHQDIKDCTSLSQVSTPVECTASSSCPLFATLAPILYFYRFLVSYAYYWYITAYWLKCAAAYALAVLLETLMLPASHRRASEERLYPQPLSVDTSAHRFEGEGRPFVHVTTPLESGISQATTDTMLNGDDELSFMNYAEEKAIRRLLESWMERLQLISVLVSFS